MGYKMCDLYKLLRGCNLDLSDYLSLPPRKRLRTHEAIKASEPAEFTNIAAVYQLDDEEILGEFLAVLKEQASKSYLNINFLPILDESESLSSNDEALLTTCNNIFYISLDEQVDLDRLFQIIPSKIPMTIITLNEEKMREMGDYSYCNELLRTLRELDVNNGKFEKVSRIQINVIKAKENVENGQESFSLFSAHDIYIGEEDSARVSYIELGVDDDPIVKQKNSGMFIRLEQNLNTLRVAQEQRHEPDFISATHVQHLLETMMEMGYDFKAPKNMENEEMEGENDGKNGVTGLRKDMKDENDNIFDDEVPSSSIEMDSQILAEKFNGQIKLRNSESGLHYRLREPIFNNTFQEIRPFGGFRTMFVRSKCTHGVVIVDGIREFKFNNGDEIVLKTDRDLRVQRVYL
ncbi:unnamed protein product [Bursaphelenchus xylophilus]|uniref:(pine wood nematode) hypothetical protein n=1 Tax=Bursaphelenchus xylophilus TaxID=6326 RepID=A0A1I7RUG0_BURXY|nr:unnamed protein product [Bursaphelenchus xylophilus]CAG9114100.1 unnamed protein product [Bursaphelenchus xylophilus]